MNLRQWAHRSAPVRMGVFFGLLLLAWSLPALILIQLWGSAGNVALILLYLLFIAWLYHWSKRCYGYKSPLQNYGLDLSGHNFKGLLLGVAIGSLSLGLLLALESVLGWLVWRQAPGIALIFAGLAVALAVGFAEELFFRGWLLHELEKDYSLGAALVTSSAIFAALHYIKPWPEIVKGLPQVFGLLLLGATLVWCKRSLNGRLGLAMGLHAGLVWAYYCIDVGDWVSYTGAVPQWVTGVNDNPLAGVMGLLCLGVIAVGIRGLRSQDRPSL
ncbi:MAG: type II CAAX endopeptidase family protein [Thermosynechococcaceae cyanobacterium]